MTRNSHDGAGAIPHKHVVCNPNGYPLPIGGIDGMSADKDAGFFTIQRLAFDFTFGDGHFNVISHPVSMLIGGEFLHKRMFWSQHHKRCAIECIRARRKNFNFVIVTVDFETQASPFTATDPVLLHELHPFRPVLQLIKIIQKFLRVIGDLEKPLSQILLRDIGMAAFAGAIHHLLVGEHSFAARTPVHQGRVTIG